MLKKLFHYGIRGIALSLFRSYITDWQQSVSLGGVNSAGKVIKHGVPQGSVLGLFVILLISYINDLFSAANKISLNASKSEYIIFKHARKPLNYDFRLFINGKRLLPSSSIKYLLVSC